MYKNITCVLIYLSMALPVVLSAGALEKYSVPQQNANVRPGSVSEDVYSNFREEIQSYSTTQINDLRIHFTDEQREAIGARNYEAVSYYNELIDSLNEQIPSPPDPSGTTPEYNID